MQRMVSDTIRKSDYLPPINFEKIKSWVIFMGMEHERIHLETSSVLIREMDLEFIRKPPNFETPLDPTVKSAASAISGDANSLWPTKYATSRGVPPQNEMIQVPSGMVALGKPWSYPTYGWDNEYGITQIQVPAFEASKFKVTNAEWLGFINAKGYEKREFWDEEGWNWVTFTNTRHPHFWIPLDASKFRYRAMFDIIEMPWDWPVEVNHLEAMAYCRWKGKSYRLISEPEWRRITQIPRILPEGEGKDDHLLIPHSIVSLDPAMNPAAQANLDMHQYSSSTPVDEYPPNALGFYDVFGNVWEWSASHFDPLPGFKTCYIYQDFSTPCFDDRHNMILGGSWASTGNETSVYARYAFRRHFFQHAGFRLCRSIESEDMYESVKLKREYLFFHYAPPDQIMPYDFGPKVGLEFPKTCADIAMEAFKSHNRLPKSSSGSVDVSALDVGCAVGRSTFELARLANRVIGIDYSQSFIDEATKLVETGEQLSTFVLEGDISSNFVARVDPVIDRSRVRFFQGDAHHLDRTLPGAEAFDIVLMANLIDRLTCPSKFLKTLSSLVRSGGIAVLTSPYTWMTQFTPKENWIGGYIDQTTGHAVETLEGLKNHLSQDFELIESRDVPFVIYEHRRKFQFSVANATIWRRK